MAKKQTKMTPEEIAVYLKNCDVAIQYLRFAVNLTIDNSWSYISLPGWMHARENCLLEDFPSALKILQSPKETSDYSEPHLRQWRAEVRRLDFIAEKYLKTLYKK